MSTSAGGESASAGEVELPTIHFVPFVKDAHSVEFSLRGGIGGLWLGLSRERFSTIEMAKALSAALAPAISAEPSARPVRSRKSNARVLRA